jgi:hypothetical protein
LDIVFNGNTGDTTQYDYTASNEEMAKRIFSDCKQEPATPDTMAEALSSQYHFDSFSNTPIKSFRDAIAKPYYNDSKYYGSNKLALHELAMYQTFRELQSDFLREKEKDILLRNGIVQPPYDSPKADHTRYEKKLNNFLKNPSPEMAEFQKERAVFYQSEHEKIDAATKKVAACDIERFILDNPESVFYILSYGDENGSFESVMEHGGIFNRVPHITISNH